MGSNYSPKNFDFALRISAFLYKNRVRFALLTHLIDTISFIYPFPRTIPRNLQEVVLPKNQGSLGFSIIGGTDHSCVPFGAQEPGIFISHVISECNEKCMQL